MSGRAGGSNRHGAGSRCLPRCSRWSQRCWCKTWRGRCGRCGQSRPWLRRQSREGLGDEGQARCHRGGSNLGRGWRTTFSMIRRDTLERSRATRVGSFMLGRGGGGGHGCVSTGLRQSGIGQQLSWRKRMRDRGDRGEWMAKSIVSTERMEGCSFYFFASSVFGESKPRKMAWIGQICLGVGPLSP